MRFAMDLLSKHNLSVAQLEQEALDYSVCAIEGHFRMERWIQHVLDAACSLYYTEYYISARKTAMFVGTPENVAVTIDVADWLISSIRKESNRLYKDSYQRRSFRLGAGWQILMRAIELSAEQATSRNSDGSGSNLMVVRNQLERANENYLSKLNLRHTKRRRVYVDGESFESGSSYGAGVALGKQAKRISQFI